MEKSSHDGYYESLQQKSYECLIALAEFKEEDMEEDRCQTAIKAMTLVFKCGSCKDKAEAIKYFVEFLMAKNELSENN